MLRKVISGGQNGADYAGLVVAASFGLETGGWMPKGYKTQGGSLPERAAKFGLSEHSSPHYAPRTFLNVKESDGTIRLAGDFGSAGELCTMKAIVQYKKPFVDVDVKNPRPVEEVKDWIIQNNICILNVAGNTERTFCGITEDVTEYLTRLFKLLGLEQK